MKTIFAAGFTVVLTANFVTDQVAFDADPTTMTAALPVSFNRVTPTFSAFCALAETHPANIHAHTKNIRRIIFFIIDLGVEESGTIAAEQRQNDYRIFDTLKGSFLFNRLHLRPNVIHKRRRHSLLTNEILDLANVVNRVVAKLDRDVLDRGAHLYA